MILQDQDYVPYLANILLISNADGILTSSEEQAIEEIRKHIKAKKSHLNDAKKIVETETYKPIKTGSFGTQILNLEDMLYVSLIDGEIGKEEEQIIKEFVSQSGITQEQLGNMVAEASDRASASSKNIICSSCSASISADSKFCPQCGTSVGEKTTPDVKKISFDIPTSGYVIEFCESTAASFLGALEYAKNAEIFDSCVRGKKNWYFASWSTSNFLNVIELAERLSGLRNRRIYINGKEVPWGEIFAFNWCARQRKSAYRPVEYCFGKDENRINPWGCKLLYMDWTGWADWFSYGSFKKSGVFRKMVWVFDKDRISHEVKTKYHPYRYCPYIRPNLIDSIIVALPDEIDIISNNDWKYNEIYEQSPGAIKVVKTEKRGGYTYKNEYFSDGVRPKGLNALRDTLNKAIVRAGITDINVSRLLK